MIDYKDCIAPIVERAFPQPPPPRKKRPARKCSTCANKRCRIRGVACDWMHCGKWEEEESFEGR